MKEKQAGPIQIELTYCCQASMYVSGAFVPYVKSMLSCYSLTSFSTELICLEQLAAYTK